MEKTSDAFAGCKRCKGNETNFNVMKKLFAILAVLCLVSLFPQNKSVAANDIPCETGSIICCDGSMHMVIVCETADLYAWYALLCPRCSSTD